MSHATPGMSASPASVGEIDTFIGLLRTACDDPKINEQLQKLLSMPDARRQGLVQRWVTDMVMAKAPADFIQAIACLADDKVAEKAYEVIYTCQRQSRWRIF
ncbi:hypothetical protein [Caenimonas sp. SL110]|uniref:hypothetical protein n=1 Tax=Caenimonas sp. SL110 TaxID=1450524 RepID=UPI0006537AF6|nr:hypothetical protein [Caenimonas sp. SL110]